MTESTETKAVSVLDPALKMLPASMADQIGAIFVPMVNKLKLFEKEHAEIMTAAGEDITDEVIERAGILGKEIARVRIDTEKLRVAQKKQIVINGKAIDGVANILKAAVHDQEEDMKSIVNHAAIQEKERLLKLRSDRLEELTPFMSEEDLFGLDCSQMTEEVWGHYLSGVKKAHTDKLAAEEKAEKDRIAAEKLKAREIEDQRLENIKLKKEAAAKDAEDKKKQAIADKAKKKFEADRAKEIKELEAKAEKDRLAAEKKQLALQKEANELRIEQDRIRDEALAKKQLEEKRIADLAKAGDGEQLAAFKEKVLALYYDVPEISDTDLKLEIRLAIKAVGELLK